VPNIIHLIRYNQPEYSLNDYVVIKAAMKNHRPDYFYIHTDVPGPGNFTGRYWNLIQRDHELFSRIRLLHLEAPSEIFGQQIKPGLIFKKTDKFFTTLVGFMISLKIYLKRMALLSRRGH